MILKLTNKLKSLMEKREDAKAKIQEVANKLLALIAKEEENIAKAKEVLQHVADM